MEMSRTAAVTGSASPGKEKSTRRELLMCAEVFRSNEQPRAYLL